MAKVRYKGCEGVSYEFIPCYLCGVRMDSGKYASAECKAYRKAHKLKVVIREYEE